MSLGTQSDAMIVVPPLSPSDTNPPLGPYLLKTCFEKAGLSLGVLDLSIRYLNRFKSGPAVRGDPVVGDQDKDRRATHAARDHFIANSPLVARPALHVPCCSDPTLGMHYSFDEIRSAVDAACKPGSFWRQFVEEHILGGGLAPPRVLGVSIMGPPQVFVALVVAKVIKSVWPRTLVVAGGSHVTLLASEIARDRRYGGDIDLFMPGHCEQEFVELVDSVRRGVHPGQLGVVPGRGRALSACSAQTVQLTTPRASRTTPPDFEIMPWLDRDILAHYDPTSATIPLQLTRGCSYARCTYCTYPAVEPVTNPTPDWERTMLAIKELSARTGVRRYSFKDSLFTPKNLRELADRLQAHGIGADWSATTILHERLTPSLLKELASAGCRTLEVGLESIDPEGQALFDKRLDMGMVHEVIEGAAEAGVVMVLNQIFGWPGQSLHSAEQQLAWYECMCLRWPGLIRASCNMLEINRASQMERAPDRFGVRLLGVAPWAFSYAWNAPEWRVGFASSLRCIHEAVGGVAASLASR